MTILHRAILLLSRVLLLVPLVAVVVPATAGERAQGVTAAQFREDVAFIRDSITRMHPDPAFSTDPHAMERALAQLARGVPPTLTVDQAWQRLAALNPLLADGHFFIGHADWRSDTQRWLAAGGSLFPLEVEVGPDGTLLVRPDTASQAAAPARIVSVDGVPADVLVPALLEKVHGDTPGFRAALLAQRWWLYYWKTYGAPERYRLVLEQGGKRRTVDLPGSRALPLVMRKEAQSPFRLAIEANGRAVLTVDSFDQADPAPFAAFTRDAFARIREAGVTELVIDISNNGGGNDALWLEGLMPYLANRPYRTGSTYRALTRPGGDAPASLVDGEIATWRQPQPDHPLRFGGKVYVKIGAGTYSSAILFANVMRDFRFATLIGSGGLARQAQSGGVRTVRLPHTGLVLSLPRFILDPPAGRSPGALLEAQELPNGMPAAAANSWHGSSRPLARHVSAPLTPQSALFL
ncbi:S41 family peptidase [Massilia consociata]|uniref:S41 family peptidase n=1 Tax=Massilia consociata TaxID=760117 RepID=A0ABV6FEC2_9BURK